MASKKIQVTDEDLKRKIIFVYNEYVEEYNRFEEEQDKNFKNKKPFDIRLHYNGPIETVQPNGNAKRSIVISFKDNPNIVYTIVVKNYGVWQNPDNFLKNKIKGEDITKVWKELVDTWY